MGLLDKLAFWKKDDLSNLGDFGMGSNNTAMDQFAPKQDPFAADPIVNDPLAKDPLGQTNEPFPSTGQERQPVNEFGIGSNALPQDKNGHFDSVSHVPSTGPYGGDSHAVPQESSSAMNKDIEIISAKIDTIRVSIENIGHKMDGLNQRLAVIEEIAKQEQKQAEEQKW